MGLLVLPFVWCLAGVSLPIATFLADGCPQAQSYIANNTGSASGAEWVSYYLECQGRNQ